MKKKCRKTKVKVWYWRGTLELSGTATTYRGAMRIAARNQNAFDPSFYDQDGIPLYNTGNGLCYDNGDYAL